MTQERKAPLYANVDLKIPADFADIEVVYKGTRSSADIWMEIDVLGCWGYRVMRDDRGNIMRDDDGCMLKEKVYGTFELRYIDDPIPVYLPHDAGAYGMGLRDLKPAPVDMGQVAHDILITNPITDEAKRYAEIWRGLNFGPWVAGSPPRKEAYRFHDPVEFKGEPHLPTLDPLSFEKPGSEEMERSRAYLRERAAKRTQEALNRHEICFSPRREGKTVLSALGVEEMLRNIRETPPSIIVYVDDKGKVLNELPVEVKAGDKLIVVYGNKSLFDPSIKGLEHNGQPILYTREDLKRDEKPDLTEELKARKVFEHHREAMRLKMEKTVADLVTASRVAPSVQVHVSDTGVEAFKRSMKQVEKNIAAEITRGLRIRD